MSFSDATDGKQSTRKRVLALSMQAPRSPGAGGETRSYYFLKALAENADLTLISLGGVDGCGRTQSDLAEICEKVIEPELAAAERIEAKHQTTRALQAVRTLGVLLLPWRGRWEGFLRYFVQFGLPGSADQSRSLGKRLLTASLKNVYRVAARFSTIPPITTFMFYRSFDQCYERLRRELSHLEYDAIWCEHSTMYPLLLRLQQVVNAPVMICNSHNIEAQLQQRFADLAPPGWASEYWNLQAMIFGRLEQKCYARSDLTFVCSEEDRQLGKSIAPNGNYSVVGNGVNSEYFQSVSTNCINADPTVVFTGGFGYEPNRDAVRFFVSEILPRIWGQRSDCRFLFAGLDAERLWNELAVNDERIQFECSPADIRPCFQRATVFVVPLRVGGGTRLKVLEAMSMGIAIVSTTLGAEGIPCESGKHLVRSDAPAEFAFEVVRLLNDSDARTSLGREAACWVRRHFDWPILSKRIHEELASVL